MAGYSFSKVFNSQPGWYSGDFHVHTDASMDGDYPPHIVAGIAKAEGLDFIAFTDHNSIDGFPGLDENLDFPVVPGIEVTLDKGHFNVFGMEDHHQWMEGIVGNPREVPLPARYQSVAELMGLTSQEGLINSINHPLLNPWDWLFEETNMQYVHCVELWNDLYWPDNTTANPKTVALWTGWLNDGYRVVAIGGSDYHYPPRPEQGLFGERLGQPTTFVYAANLSVAAILDGVRAGRAYVSRGPRVDFQAFANGKSFMIGDDMGDEKGRVEFTASIADHPQPVLVKVVKNGEVIAEGGFSGEETSVQLADTLNPGKCAWYRLEVYNDQGEALTITNPIFANFG